MLSLVESTQAITRENELDLTLMQMCKHCAKKDPRAKTSTKEELEKFIFQMAQGIKRGTKAEWTEQEANALKNGTIKVEGYDEVKKQYAAIDSPDMPGVFRVWIKASQDENLTELHKRVLKDSLPYFVKEHGHLWNETLTEEKFSKISRNEEWVVRRDAARIGKYFILTETAKGEVLFKIEFFKVRAKMTFTDDGKVEFKKIRIQKDDSVSAEIAGKLQKSAEQLKLFLTTKDIECGILHNGCLSLRTSNGMHLVFGKDE